MDIKLGLSEETFTDFSQSKRTWVTQKYDKLLHDWVQHHGFKEFVVHIALKPIKVEKRLAVNLPSSGQVKENVVIVSQPQYINSNFSTLCDAATQTYSDLELLIKEWEYKLYNVRVNFAVTKEELEDKIEAKRKELNRISEVNPKLVNELEVKLLKSQKTCDNLQQELNDLKSNFEELEKKKQKIADNLDSSLSRIIEMSLYIKDLETKSQVKPRIVPTENIETFKGLIGDIKKTIERFDSMSFVEIMSSDLLKKIKNLNLLVNSSSTRLIIETLSLVIKTITEKGVNVAKRFDHMDHLYALLTKQK